MNGKRVTPFQSWLDWNPEHRMLYRFIISQLHYDGLSTIALVLAQSLHQINSMKPSNDLSQLVSMCVQWGQQAGNTTAFSPVVKPQATFPFSSLQPSDMLGALSQNKSSYEAELVLQENLIAAMRKHRSELLKLPRQGLSPPRNTPCSLTLHSLAGQISTASVFTPSTTPTRVFTPSTTPTRMDSAMLCSPPLHSSTSPAGNISPPRSRHVFASPGEEEEEEVAGTKRLKSDESMGEESPKRQCQRFVSDSSSSTEPVSIKSEQEGTPSSPQLSSSAEENEQGMFTPISALNSWTCPKCDTNVTNMSDLAAHIKLCLNGQGDNYCNECGRGYSSKASLQRHISVVHRKERNYECHICRKRFGQQIHVDVHMRLHTGEKPFVCHMCNDSFKQSAHLKRHMQCHIRSPSELSLYRAQKQNTSPYKRHDLEKSSHQHYETMLSRLSDKSRTLARLRDYPYLLPGSLTADTLIRTESKVGKTYRHGLLLGEPVLGELQNKYTMELIKLIGQTADEQRKDIGR